MKTIGLVRLNLVCLGEAAVQLKLKLEDLPQARQGSCALLAVCFMCLNTALHMHDTEFG